MRFLWSFLTAMSVTTLFLAQISSGAPEKPDWKRVLPEKAAFPGATSYQVTPFGKDGVRMAVDYPDGPTMEVRVVAHRTGQDAINDVKQWVSNRVVDHLIRHLPSGASPGDDAWTFGEKDKRGYLGSVTLVARRGRYVGHETLMFRANALDGTPRQGRPITAHHLTSAEAVLGGIIQRLRN